MTKTEKKILVAALEAGGTFTHNAGSYQRPRGRKIYRYGWRKLEFIGRLREKGLVEVETENANHGRRGKHDRVLYATVTLTEAGRDLAEIVAGEI